MLKFKILRVAYLILCLLIVPEVFLRVCGFHGESYKGNLIRYDDRLGWALVPNTKGYDSEFEWRVKYVINQDGLRERPVAVQKDKNTYRVLVLGDSFAEGYGIRQDRRFSAVSEDILKNYGKRIEIINAGVRGYNLVQYYLCFEGLYQKYDPDLVIIAAVSGDLDVVTDTMMVDNATVYYRPYYSYTPGDNALAIKGVPVPKPDANIFKDDTLEIVKRYLRKSAVYTFLRIVSDKNILLQKALIFLHMKKDVYSRPEYGKYLKFVYGPSHDPMLYNAAANENISKKIIADMVSTVKKDGRRLMIFLLTDDSLGTNRGYYETIKGEADFLFGYFPALCPAYAKDSKKFHFRFDPHFNEKGNYLVARTLADFITANIK